MDQSKISRGINLTSGRLRLGSTFVSFAILLAVSLAPAFVTNQYILDVLLRALLFAMLGIGLNIVVAQAGLLDLGYIAFWGIGAYTTAILSSPKFDLHLGFFMVTALSALAACVFAMIIGFPTLRLRGDYLAIVTLGFGEIVRIALNNLDPLTGGPSGIQSIDPPTIFGIKFGYALTPYYYLALAMVVLGVVVATVLFRSRIGLSWTALRDDELAARASGIKPLRMYLLAFGTGAFFAGLSGSIFARVQGSVSPDSFVVDQSFMVLAIVILAGFSRRTWPVLIAAGVIIVLPELLRGFQNYRMLVFGFLLVAVVVFRENSHRIKGFLVLKFGRTENLAAPITVPVVSTDLLEEELR